MLSTFNIAVGVIATIIIFMSFNSLALANTILQQLFSGVMMITTLLFAIMLILIRNGEITEGAKKK